MGAMYDVKYCWTGMTSSQTDSLRLVLWAQSLGLNEELMAALGWRHYGHGRRLADHKVLLEAAEEAGLEREEAVKVLKSDMYAEELRDISEDFGRQTMIKPAGCSDNVQMGAIPMILFRVAGRPKREELRLQGSQPQTAFEHTLERLEDLVL